MEFKKYQEESQKTDRNPKPDVDTSQTLSKSEIIPLLGLVGEAGNLLSEYKKKLRDSENYSGFKEQIKEELGDVLWYISNIATKFKLNLEDIANENLKKVNNYFGSASNNKKLYDDDLSSDMRFPREFSYKFICKEENEKKTVEIKNKDGQTIGSPLNDNSYKDDGYRYHDIMHLVFMAKFGWSPVWRDLLRNNTLKERPNHDVQDSGRSQIIEESIILSSYLYASKHNFLIGIERVDIWLLKYIQELTCHLEVRNRSGSEWNQVLIEGFKLWKQLQDNKGGIIEGNLIERKINYKEIDH